MNIYLIQECGINEQDVLFLSESIHDAIKTFSAMYDCTIDDSPLSAKLIEWNTLNQERLILKEYTTKWYDNFTKKKRVLLDDN